MLGRLRECDVDLMCPIVLKLMFVMCGKKGNTRTNVTLRCLVWLDQVMSLLERVTF